MNPCVELLESKMTFVGQGKWQCIDCGYESKRNHVRDHVEAKHMENTLRYFCEYCSQALKNNKALQNHRASGRCKRSSINF